MNAPGSVRRAALKAVARRHGLDLIVLFGSRARGRGRPGSDTDVAVLRGPGARGRARGGASPATVMALTEALARVLRPPEGVDLVDLGTAPPLLHYEIARRGVVAYERRPGTFSRFRIYAARRYDDNRKFFDAVARYVRRHCG